MRTTAAGRFSSALVGLTLLVATPRAQEPGPPQAAIDRAIDDGVRFLQRAQYLDGSWGYRVNAAADPGHAAFACYALLRAGVPPEHATVRRTLALIESVDTDVTYALAALTLLYAELGPPNGKRELDRIAELVAGIEATCDERGLAGYSTGSMNAFLSADLSNSLFAALAFRAAERVDRGPSTRRWLELAEGTLTRQEGARLEGPLSGGAVEPRGFRYRESTASGSMTAAALTILACAEDALGRSLPRELAGRIREARAGAHAWIEAHMDVSRNPGSEEHALWWLWGLERLGALEERALLGGVDWYAEGATLLLRTQAEDGGWGAGDGLETPLALLFLARASRGESEARRPSTGTGGRGLPAGVFASAENAPVRLRARVDTDSSEVALWIDAVSSEVAAALRRAGEDGLRLERVALFVGAPGELPGELVHTLALERTRPTPLRELHARFEPGSNGRFWCTARLYGYGPERAGGAPEPFVFESPPLEVAVEGGVPPDALEYGRDRARDLFGQLPASTEITVRASTTAGGAAPANVLDGQLESGWLSAPGDAAPWIRIELTESLVARTLILTPTGARLADAGAPRPLRGTVRIGSRELPFTISPDVLRKTTLDLGGQRRVRSIEVRVEAVRAGVLGEDPVGFASIELRR